MYIKKKLRDYKKTEFSSMFNLGMPVWFIRIVRVGYFGTQLVQNYVSLGRSKFHQSNRKSSVMFGSVNLVLKYFTKVFVLRLIRLNFRFKLKKIKN